ncbi:MAG: glycosyl transferase group 1 [Rhodocyclaceae bacterium]|nr:MAG: glycosyl transferase group 1 [Rhodocyclaceae bacterium]TND06082.1 MAG: glycosyl transferase group 1 [Rhodocyclaceae bacterium]
MGSKQQTPGKTTTRKPAPGKVSPKAVAPAARPVSLPSAPDVAEMMNRAVALHQSGQREEAVALYRQVLAVYPEHVDALHLLGVAHCHGREFEQALPLFENVIRLKPDFPDAYNNLGKALKSVDRLADAERVFRRATEFIPSAAEAWTNLGRLKRREGAMEESIACYRKALEAGSGDAEAHHFLGLTLRDSGKLDEAIVEYRKAIELKPDYADALHNLAGAIRDKGDLKGAIETYERAIAIKPDFAAALTNLGNALQEAGRIDEAIERHRHALALEPNLSEAHNNLGALFMAEERTDEAIESFKAAIACHPDFAPAWSNLGNIHVGREEIEEARRCYGEALRIKPDFAEALTNLGNLLQDFVSLDEGLASYDKAIAINPKFPGARFGRALVRLMMGDLKGGFEDYESRWEGSDQAKKVKPPRFSCPQWKGEKPRAGARIIVYYEQGFGDTIEFCRYVPLLAKRFKHVTFIVQTELYRLVAQSMGDKVRVVPGDQAQQVVREHYDFHCPSMSLPLAFGTTLETVPADVPYLFAGNEAAKRWRDRFADEKRPRIGLVWHGSRGFRGDRYRSVPLQAFAPLLAHDDVAWISLQKVRPDVPMPAELTARLIDYMEDVKDFADTAALLAELDMIISVDTAVVHLAGALGRPAWLLNRFNSEWRWMRGRSDSPWYPTLRLFNQKMPSVWDPVLESIAEELPEWLAQWRGHVGPDTRPDALPYQPPQVEVVNADRYQMAGLPSRSRSDRVQVTTQQSAPPPRDAERIGRLIQEGFAAHQAGRLDEAMARYRQVLELDPEHPDAWHLIGVIHGARREHDQAMASIRRALTARPGDPVYLGNLGIACAAAGHHAEAADAYRNSLAADARQPAAAYNYGNALAELGRPAEAVAAYRQALALRPDYVSAWLNLGNVLRDTGAFDDAEAAYLHVLELSHDHAGAQLNLGNIRRELGDPVAARELLERALAKEPDNFRAWNNLGSALRDAGDLDAALLAYRRCLEIAPDHAEGHLNLAMGLLAAGKFAEGWREYEWRWEGAHEARRHKRQFPMPQWRGEPLIGRSILLHAEQGLGDALQFVRYAMLVGRRGARVVVECHSQLKRLFELLPGIERVLAQGEALPVADFHCPFMSLPFAFGTTLDTVPASTPYLWADPWHVKSWAARLAGDPRPRVGLVWAGNPRLNDPGAHLLDRRRSLPAGMLAPILGVDGVRFVSLQKGDAAKGIDYRLTDWTGELNDFADTAALVRNLDLVIAVDTSVAHLAAGLGVPVWLLSRFDSCWRWLTEREDSPWYPTMRIFRQAEYGQWGQVIERVGRELNEWRSNRNAESPHGDVYNDND